ncbi:MAG TPA: DUF4293 domain-containing protein [Chitinophagaceae bacterium]|nr:DUF4293 domain-containing protein [Chitinophagaceae bacterium]
MIQRTQSLWLLITAVCSFLTLKFDFYAGTDAAGIASQLSAKTNMVLTILASGIGTASFITIFLYKQRKLQIKICAFAFIVSAIFLTLLFLKLKNFASGTISLWAIFYFAIPLFLIFAMRGIWKDEKLIKSMDKLR